MKSISLNGTPVSIAMCKYNNHYYWENALLQKNDVWKNSLTEENNIRNTLFINTALIDYPRRILDNNWSCYPDSKSVLGFLQYMYLPMAFHCIMHPDITKLYIPVASTDIFLSSIKDSNVREASFMLQSLERLSPLWELDETACRAALFEFCQWFNKLWQQDSIILHIGFYAHAEEIAQAITATYDFPDMLQEDLGYTPEELTELCASFYTNPFMRKTLIKLLNNTIGCIV